MFPAIFLDRDGVLIENRSDYVRDWSHVKIYPEAVRALTLSPIKNYKIVIVTNQSAVGRGIISIETANEINDRLIKLIGNKGGQVNAVYMCPHKPDDNCSCRKPKPGLLLRASQELSLDLTRSWMIGDAWTDVLAGQAAGVRQAILVKTGRGKEQLLHSPPKIIGDHMLSENLLLAIETIFAIDKMETE
jgi:D-glycero-D-manno-heptose 1,7-bisphosphate phosphatase